MTDATPTIRALLHAETLQDFCIAYAPYLSRNGLFLPLGPEHARAPGEAVRVQLVLASRMVALACEGIVEDVIPLTLQPQAPPCGVLLSFTSLSKRSVQLIERIEGLKTQGRLGATLALTDPTPDPDERDDTPLPDLTYDPDERDDTPLPDLTHDPDERDDTPLPPSLTLESSPSVEPRPMMDPDATSAGFPALALRFDEGADEAPSESLSSSFSPDDDEPLTAYDPHVPYLPEDSVAFEFPGIPEEQAEEDPALRPLLSSTTQGSGLILLPRDDGRPPTLTTEVSGLFGLPVEPPPYDETGGGTQVQGYPFNTPSDRTHDAMDLNFMFNDPSSAGEQVAARIDTTEPEPIAPAPLDDGFDLGDLEALLANPGAASAEPPAPAPLPDAPDEDDEVADALAEDWLADALDLGPSEASLASQPGQPRRLARTSGGLDVMAYDEGTDEGALGLASASIAEEEDALDGAFDSVFSSGNSGLLTRTQGRSVAEEVDELLGVGGVPMPAADHEDSEASWGFGGRGIGDAFDREPTRDPNVQLDDMFERQPTRDPGVPALTATFDGEPQRRRMGAPDDSLLGGAASHASSSDEHDWHGGDLFGESSVAIDHKPTRNPELEDVFALEDPPTPEPELLMELSDEVAPAPAPAPTLDEPSGELGDLLGDLDSNASAKPPAPIVATTTEVSTPSLDLSHPTTLDAYKRKVTDDEESLEALIQAQRKDLDGDKDGDGDILDALLSDVPDGPTEADRSNGAIPPLPEPKREEKKGGFLSSLFRRRDE